MTEEFSTEVFVNVDDESQRVRLYIPDAGGHVATLDDAAAEGLSLLLAAAVSGMRRRAGKPQKSPSAVVEAAKFMAQKLRDGD